MIRINSLRFASEFAHKDHDGAFTEGTNEDDGEKAEEEEKGKAREERGVTSSVPQAC